MSLLPRSRWLLPIALLITGCADAAVAPPPAADSVPAPAPPADPPPLPDTTAAESPESPESTELPAPAPAPAPVSAPVPAVDAVPTVDEPVAAPAPPLPKRPQGRTKPAGRPAQAGDPKSDVEAPTPPTSAVAVTRPVGPCGGDDEPMCPLQAWMDRHMQTALDREDLPALAKALRTAAKMAPDPAWNIGDRGWASMAKAAAAAADGGDLVTARKSCKGCHRAWRKKYKAQHRKRRVP